MTNQEIMVQILHEVSGKPKKQVKKIVKAIRAALPDRGRNLDEVLPPAEATELLKKLRAEKAGILQWLLEGAMEARLEMAMNKMPLPRTPFRG